MKGKLITRNLKQQRDWIFVFGRNKWEEQMDGTKQAARAGYVYIAQSQPGNLAFRRFYLES